MWSCGPRETLGGNSKFGDFFYKLFPNKDIENAENMYNHNFRGSYCTCGRPYLDPDVEEPVEMIQCCICEDWFHEEHFSLETSNEVVSGTFTMALKFPPFFFVLITFNASRHVCMVRILYIAIIIV